MSIVLRAGYTNANSSDQIVYVWRIKVKLKKKKYKRALSETFFFPTKTDNHDHMI